MLCLLYGREMEKSNITFADTLIEIVKSKDEPTNHNAGGVVGAQGTVCVLLFNRVHANRPLCYVYYSLLLLICFSDKISKKGTKVVEYE